jgi:hypothetical protein
MRIPLDEHAATRRWNELLRGLNHGHLRSEVDLRPWELPVYLLLRLGLPGRDVLHGNGSGVIAGLQALCPLLRRSRT